MSIRTRMILWVLGSTLIVFFAILSISYKTGKGLVIQINHQSIANQVQSCAARFEADFRQIAQVPKDMALMLEQNPNLSENEMKDLLRRVISKNTLIYGSAIAFEPGAFHRDRRFFSPYCFRRGKEIIYQQIGGEQYQYFHWDWYIIPKLLKKPIWTEPYYDEGGGDIIMTTFSVPFFNPDSSVRGIVTADVDLEKLRRTASSVQVGVEGYAFVLSQNGTMIVHPDSTWIMRESIFSIAESKKSERLRRIGQQMTAGSTRIEVIEDFWRGGTGYLAYTPILPNGWSFAVMLPEKEVMAAVLTLNRKLILFMALGLAGLLVAVTLVSYSLTRPLKKLVCGAKQLAAGHLDTKIEGIRQKDEIGELGVAFNRMVEDLNKYVQDLTETTRAKEKVERELSIAHDIQQSILPHTYPPFPERKEIDVFAVTHPAREVGGDFYDFFFIDPVHLGLVVADVSGKGVPAALFMAITRTLIKTAAMNELSPRKTLLEVNSILYPDNPSSMFVTVFYAVYDIRDGSIRFANAGHNLPYVKRKDGSVEEVHPTKSIALGVVETIEIEESRLHLETGDFLMLYTDGLTDAENSEGTMYEENRVRQFLDKSHSSGNMRDLITGLIDSVYQFMDGKDQFDDITLMALKRMV